MTKGKIRKTTTVEENISPELEEITGEGAEKAGEISPIDQELQDYIQSIGEPNLSVKIFKQEVGRSAFTYMDMTTVSNATEQYIQENFGPGVYQIRCFFNGKFKGAKTIHIGSGPVKREPESFASPISALPDNEPTYMNPMQYQLEAMREEARTTRELLLKMIDNNSHAKSSTMELMEVMTMMRGLAPAPSEGLSPMKLIAEILPFVKEIMKMTGANVPAEEETGWLGIANKVVEKVPDMFKLMQRGAIPAPNGAAVAIPSIPEGPISFLPPAMQNQIAGIFEFLKGRARVNADPLSFVDLAMNTLDLEQSLNVVRLLDKSYEEIATIDPDILEPTVFRPWFEQFFEGLRNAIKERNNPDGGESDPADPGNNARLDASGKPKRS